MYTYDKTANNYILQRVFFDMNRGATISHRFSVCPNIFTIIRTYSKRNIKNIIVDAHLYYFDIVIEFKITTSNAAVKSWKK